MTTTCKLFEQIAQLKSEKQSVYVERYRIATTNKMSPVAAASLSHVAGPNALPRIYSPHASDANAVVKSISVTPAKVGEFRNWIAVVNYEAVKEGEQPGQQPGGTYLLPWLRPAKVWLDSELLSTTGTHDKDGNRVRTEAPANDLQDIPRQFLPRISRGQPLLNATKNFREWGEVIELVEGAVGKSNSSKFFGFAAKNCMVRSISSSKQLQEGPHTFFEVRFTIQLGDVASNKTAGGMFKVPHRAWLVKDPNGAGLIAAVKDGQLLAEPPYLNKTTGEMTQDETFTEVDYGNTFDFKKFKIDEPK